MKTTTLSICFVLGLTCLTNQSFAQTDCKYPTRLGYDFALDLPAGFTGTKDFKVYKDRTVNVTTKSCEGPFKVVITNADGTAEPARIYTRGEVMVDTMYIEAPEPPYDLEMIVQTIYLGKEVKK